MAINIIFLLINNQANFQPTFIPRRFLVEGGPRSLAEGGASVWGRGLLDVHHTITGLFPCTWSKRKRIHGY